MRLHMPHQSSPVARRAADVELGARLGVGEEARPEAHPAFRSEELVHERGQRALQIGQRDVLADDEAFDLREHRRVREIEVVAAVDAPRRDQPDRRLMLLHVADLHPRRMRPQQRRRRARSRAHGGREIERVLHVARGMLGRHVERFEVVIVVFELGAFDDQEAEAREDGFDALAEDA